jgi:hypothetical protein
MNTAKAFHPKIELKHFRTHAGVEVDFVLFVSSSSNRVDDSEIGIWAIEVKTSFPTGSDAKGLKFFAQKMPKAQLCFITSEPLSSDIAQPCISEHVL